MKIIKNLFIILMLSSLVACSGASVRNVSKFKQKGKASYYGKKYQGRLTASGQKFNMYNMTAAHRKLPFGTKVKVTNLKNGKSVIVTVNDRGPFAKRRIIDLSFAAAKKIGMLKSGVVKVKIKVVK